MATQALYLKYRPQTFDDVIGQEHITHTLLNMVRQDRIRHAYLFSGPRGTGKTTNARLLAKAVNCVHEDIMRHPCNECHVCTAIGTGRFLDVIEIDAASNTGVDDVRDLRDKIAFAPNEGRYKVYIIDEVHRFSGAAFDALLKTLEEPPSHAIFVLATTEIDKVPATIKSRCLTFEFRRVSLREVVNRLREICNTEGIQIDDGALELIARQGTGSVRDSISLLDQIVADPTEHISYELAQQMLGAAANARVQEVIEAIIAHDAAYGLNMINQAIDEGADPRQFGRQVVEHLRQLLLVQVGSASIVDGSDELRMVLSTQAERISRGILLNAVKAFNAAIYDMRGGWQPQLPLELALVESLKLVQEVVEVAPAPRRAMSPAPSSAVSAPPSSTPAAPSGGEIGLGDVKARWNAIKAEMKRQYKNFAALLDHVEPIRLDGTTLTVATMAFFKQKLDERPQEFQAFRQLLQQMLNQPISLQFEIRDETDTSNANQSSKKAVADNEVLAYLQDELGATITRPDEP